MPVSGSETRRLGRINGCRRRGDRPVAQSAPISARQVLLRDWKPDQHPDGTAGPAPHATVN
jgi:hypothetical protein